MSADLWKEFGPGVISQASDTFEDQPVIEDPNRVDDWGDFEEAKIQHSSTGQELRSEESSAVPNDAPYSQFGRNIDSELLFDAETERKSGQGQAGSSDHEQNLGPFRGSVCPESGLAAVNHPVTDLPQSPSHGIDENVDEEWADFEAPIQHDICPHISSLHVSNQKALSLSVDLPPTNNKNLAMAASHTDSSSPEQGSLSTSPSKSLPPPSDIPPPSILLSLATLILPSLVANLKKLMSLSIAAPRQDIHSISDDQMVYQFSALRAMARIVAGRKHRWKRDTLLAQSVKIGPSHGGRAGGMKLAGVDKMEGRREDQEVTELVRAWRQHAGPLKASISKLSKMNTGQNMSIPEISENQNARLVKGALTAPKPCAICGLKRDERLDKVDFAIEDSFGEYWEEHWGHVDCKKFWNTYYTELQQR